VFDLYAAKNKYLDFVDKNQIRTKLDEAYAVFKAVHQDVLDNINKNKIISQEDEIILKQELKIFFESGR
jgi:F0F1-type ATP synthase alpha subunit